MFPPLPSKSVVTALVIATLLGTQLLGNVDVSKSAAVKPHLGVVAILVDETVYSNPTSYDGLNPEYGNAAPKTTLKGRIDRYAEAVQAALPMTKSVIVRVKPDETPENIMYALEKLYFEGDGDEDAITKLTGVVLVGEVPISVVTKKDNRYLSLMPYTDFEDKVYLFNVASGDFERSPEISNPAPEVWHGVIAPPVSGEAGNELLAEYFDKNHLFRQGYEDFRAFDTKLFYADTVAEKKVLNRTGMEAYERFVDHWEEAAYNRYTTSLARELYEEVNGSLTGADGLDNDGDGLIDEDPINGQDDDADGLIDEDDGNPDYGIDNDGDCWARSPSLWDSNGDGRACSVGDDFVDEDGPDDNNNDRDKLRDEDNPGDANGDGCPGQCNKDEDGDSEDWDGDHFPNGFEIEILDSDPTKKKNPSWIRWSAIPVAEKEIIESLYTDEVFPTYEPNCFTPVPGGPPPLPLVSPFIPPRLLLPPSLPPVWPSSYFNGALKWNPNGILRSGERCGDLSEDGSTANDDDEDGRIDEDTEFDNDADGDGQVDEDRAGNPLTDSSGDMFSQVPDIQSKKIIQSFFKKYPELFKRFLGSLNEWVDFTGRYSSSYLDPNGQRVSDRATLMGLIGERDEYVQLVLKSVNDLLEQAVDEFVEENELATEIPLVGAVTIGGAVNFMGQDLDGEYTVPLPPAPVLPRTFINFNLAFVPTTAQPLPNAAEDFRTMIYGLSASELSSVGQCSLYRGSYDEGGDNQLVEANRVYNYKTAGSWDDQEVNDETVYGGQSYAGCYGNFGETPEYCFPEFSQHPVRNQAGTRLVADPNIEVDYRSCTNLRDLASFFGEASAPGTGYFFYAVGPQGLLQFYRTTLDDLENTNVDPTDPLSKPFFNGYSEPYDQDQDGDFDDDDLLLHMDNYRAQLVAAGVNDDPVKHPDDIELVNLPGYFLTLGAVLDRLGTNKNSPQEVGDFLVNTAGSATVTFPNFETVDSADLTFQRLYVTDPLAPLSGVPPLPYLPFPSHEAALANPTVVRIPSTLKHVEPVNSTINAQLAAGFSEALPIDDPRYLSFQDQDLEYARIDYPNLYDVASWEDLEEQLDALEDSVLADVAGTTPDMQGFLTNLLGTKIFETQVKDALDWRQMNIDQKHKWVLSSYLNPEVETFVGAPESGFETFYLVADGEADRVNMSFYANTVEKDEDYEFNHLEPAPEGEAEPAAVAAPVADEPGTYDVNDPTSDHISWFPFVWIYDMVAWVEELGETVAHNAAATVQNAEDGLGLELACGGIPTLPGEPEAPDADHDGFPDDEDSSPYSSDGDKDGVPDGAAKSARLSLEWEDERVLYANGTDRATLRVRVLDANGRVNTFDDFSTVELEVTDGSGFGNVVEAGDVPLVNGEATFAVTVTKTAGTLTVRAKGASDNLEGVKSNTLALTSRTRHLKLSTYEKEFVTQNAVIRTETLEDVLILNEDEVAVAVAEADTGTLRLFDDEHYRVVVREGTGESSTRLEVVPAGGEGATAGAGEGGGGEALATYVLRPDVERVTLETTPGALRGLVNDVRVLDRNPQDEWRAEVRDGNVVFLRDGKSVGLVKPDGRVYLKDGVVISLGLGAAYPAIDNPHWHLTVNLGEAVLFDVVVGTETGLLDIATPEGDGVASEARGPRGTAKTRGGEAGASLLNFFKGIPRARAASALVDSDGDGLDDLSEWTIGTDIEFTDSDGDSYPDRTELFNGFDPLNAGARLFTDLSPDHEAFSDVIELYTRGIVGGYPDGSFRPDNAITREEFTKLNLGAVCTNCTNFTPSVQEEVDRTYASHPFPDVNIDPTLLACVAHSRNEELVSGYKGGEFTGYYLPKNTMSRAEATKVLLETAGISVPDIRDLSAPWYMNYVIAAEERGLYPDGRFAELDSLTGSAFGIWFAKELVRGGPIKTWLESPITRGEFSMMVGNLTRVQDCRLKDTDGDGLPDMAETFNHATDPFNPDTDYGGVNDYIEVVNGQNAVNDPSDDFGSAGAVDGAPAMPIPSEPSVTAPPDASADSDDDGFTDAEEAAQGTGLFDPDTDDGGVTDFEEILAGTDPLDPLDEADALEDGSGAEVSGLHLSRDSVYAVDNEDVLFESKRFTTLIPADGASQLFLKAEMIGEDGTPDTNDNSTVVEFVAVDPSVPYADILREQVRMTDGVAETEILANTVSGYFDVTATVQSSPSGDVPVRDTTIHVYPGEPASIELASESAYMKSGGLNSTAVTLSLRDRFDNVAYMAPYTVTLSVNGPGILDVKDEDSEQAGTQVTVYEGHKTFDLISGESEGTATVLVRFGDVSGTLDVEVVDDLVLELHPGTPELTANGATQTTVEAWAVLNGSGTPLAGFNGTVRFGLLDEVFGSLVGPAEVRMENGKASIEFATSTVAGQAIVTAAMTGLDPASLELTLLPGLASYLEISSSSNVLATTDTVEVQVKAYDAYDNFVHTDSSTPVSLRVTPHTTRFGSVNVTEGVLSGGMAVFDVSARDLTGPIDVVASSLGLRSAAYTIGTVLAIEGSEFSDMQPDVLFGALLGSAFGDPTKPDYVAGRFTFSGTTQAALSLASDPSPHRRLAAFDSNGNISILDGNAVDGAVSPSNSATLPTRFFIKDLLTKQTTAEGVIVPSVSDFYVLDFEDDLQAATENGFHVQPILKHERYELREAKGNVSLLEDKNEIVRLQPNGQIQIFDPNYSLQLNEDFSGFAFDVMLGEAPVIRVLWKQPFDQDVTRLSSSFKWEDWATLEPGVYFKGTDSSVYGYEVSYSGNSSLNPQGMFVVDKTDALPANQRPGLGKNSLESAQITPGVGFDGDNKFMLALSDGMTVGEAHQFYPSDIGIVLGDPTIRLTDANPQEISATGYTKGLGRLILSGTETIRDVSSVDYNSDGLTDVLVAYENGLVELLENRDAYPRFTNRGPLLNFSNGIIDMTENDFNDDNQTDLVVATAESCIQGEVCIYLYTNHEANFVRKNLGLEIDGNTIKQIESEDVNNDGFPDLIISDLSGSILVFYNDRGTILTEGQLLGNLGVQLDDVKELLEEVMVYYGGMPRENSNTPADDGWFKEFPIPAPEGFSNASEKFADPVEGLPHGGFDPSALAVLAEGDDSAGASGNRDADSSKVVNNVPFIYADADERFASSSKSGKDVNGGIVKDGDLLEYTVRLVNEGASEVDDLALSDVVSTMLALDWDSFACTASPGGNCSAMQVTRTGLSARPFTVSGLSLEAGSTVEISYAARVKGAVIPKVKIFTGHDLDPAYPDDDFIDIAATPEDNPTGQIVTFYSNGTVNDNGLKKVNYAKSTSTPAPPPKTNFFEDLGIDLTQDEDGDGTPDDLQGDSSTGPPAAATSLYNGQTKQDDDGDGLNNLWDDTNGQVNPEDVMANVENGLAMAGNVTSLVADTMETLMSQFLCSGGCISSPVNYAFLVPGPINLFGIPVFPMDMAHIPVFGAPASGIPPIWPPMPWQGTTAVRIYVSITTTLGFTISVCVGSYLSGQCWTFAIPLFEALGVCDAVNGALSDALSQASSAISSGVNKLMSLPGEIPKPPGAGGRSESGGLVNYDLGSYAVAADSGSGNRVPGFPKPFAEWLRKQSEEVVNKLTDLPDIYFYYPDPQSIVGAFKPQNVDKIDSADLRGLEKILTVLNSFPILRIETEEVYFKIPAVTNDEIEKLKTDYTQWLDDMKDQWSAVQTNWQGVQYADARDEIQQLLTNVEKNLETLEDYKNFPKELLKWRNAESYYIKQIICYLDAIINNLVGWVVVNKGRVEQWIQAFYDTKESLKSWQNIFQLAVDYQESCDQCTNDRLSLFELLSKLFIFIPEPPVIPIPRWPDIVIDLSQIQAGLTVVWPEIKFRQEPLLLPRLPRIRIPETPNFATAGNAPGESPGDRLPDTSNFDFPNIPLLPQLPELPPLPELPGIPIPELPNLPPPPVIPKLPEPLSVTLKVVSGLIKILCLIQSGIIPTAETSLKTSVEDMTQRPLDPVLPLDLSVNFQAPAIPIDFVDQIEIITYINLGLNFDGIVRAVQLAADAASDVVTNLVDAANEGLTTVGSVASEAVNAPGEAAEEGLDVVEGTVDEGTGAVEGAVDQGTEAVEDATDVLDVTDEAASLDLNRLKDLALTQEARNMLTNPYVQPYIDEWTRGVADLERFADEQAALNASVPSVHHLQAEQGYLSFSPEEVETRFAALQERYFGGTLERLEDSPLNELRDGLLASFDEHENDTRALATSLQAVQTGGEGNWDELNRWIADTGRHGSPVPEDVMLASAASDSEATSAFDNLRSWVVESLSTTNENPLATDIEDLESAKERYLADAGSGFGEQAAPGLSQPTIVNQGLFIYNDVAGVNERLIAYTGESDDDVSHLVFTDMDNDRDDDIIYGYGSNLYLKENFNQNKPLDHVTDNPAIVNLEDLVPRAPAVNLYRTKESGNRSAAATWQPAEGEVFGYELRMFDALPDFEADHPSITHRATFLANVEPLRPALMELSGDATTALTADTVIPGTLLESGEDTLRLDYEFPEGDGRVMASKNTSLFAPDLEVAVARLLDLEGLGFLAPGSRTHTLVKSSDELSVAPGTLLSAAKDAQFTLTFSDASELEFDLPAGALFTLSAVAPDAAELRVQDGWVEVITDTVSDEPQRAFSGMILLDGERMVYDRGLALEHTTARGQVEVTYEGAGDFEWHGLTDERAPGLDLVMENGDYYSQLRTILPDGGRGTWGETQLFSPQICSDTTLPYPNIGATNQRVSVFKTLTLDGSGSFDSDSPITRYYWDVDLETDADGDGDPTNDADAHHDTDPLTDYDHDEVSSNDWDDPTLVVGPWDTPGAQRFKLWVTDEAGNTAGAVVTVDVFVPEIELLPSSGRTGAVEGGISTTDDGIPFVIARERDGVFELISTPSATENSKYFTEEGGRFAIEDLELSEAWAVVNSSGTAVAEVDPDTGRLSLAEQGYTVEVKSAELPWPTRVVLKDPTDFELLSIFMVPDSNVDASIDENAEYTAETVASLTGVHVTPKELPSSLHLEKIPSNEPLFTGGVMLKDDAGTRQAIIDTDGNIYELADLDLGVKNLEAVNETADQAGADPIVLTLGQDESVWLEIFISPRARPNDFTTTRFVSAESLGLERNLTPLFGGIDTERGDRDADGISDLDELRAGLNPFDPTDAAEDLDNDHLTNAEEFRYATNPNRADTDGDGVNDFDELKQGTDPLKDDASYFKDVSVNDPLYDQLYQFVQLDIVDGFPEADGIYFKPDQLLTRAEYTKILLAMLCITPRPEALLAPPVFNDIPFQTEELPWYYAVTKESYLQGFIFGYLGEADEGGQAPFKPDRSITRAEGSKIILEALETLGAVDLGSVSAGEPWYAPYMDAAQDLRPYLAGRTSGEGATYIVTRDEASRPNEALTRYDFMVMAGRVLSALNCFADRDSDGDGLSDFEEVTVYGTDPFDADTDHGGFMDGKEVSDGSHPLDRSDDDTDGDGLVDLDETGVYGTDPYDSDTDDGGVNDGEEVLNGTEPMRTPEDDTPEAPPSSLTDDFDDLAESVLEESNAVNGLDPGLFIVTYACTACPCDLTIENTADIASGDTIFAAIMDATNQVLLAISNKVAVSDLLSHSE